MNYLKISIYGLATAGFFVLLNGCHSANSATGTANAATTETAAQEAPDAPAKLYPVVAVAAARPISNLTLPGELVSYYETDLYPKVNGYVRRMLVDIGDHVRTGQILADLEAPELTAQLAESFAQVKNAEGLLGTDRTTYRRLVRASQTPGAVSPYDLDVARGKVVGDSLTMVGAMARYRASQEMIGYLKLRAPFSGIITDRQLAPGALVGPGQKATVPLYRLKQQDRLRLQLSVPEKYVDDVRRGTAVQFTVNSLPNQFFRAHINRLSYNVQRQIRSMVVEVEVANPGNRLVPGMFAQVQIPIRRSHTSLVVPTTAVVTNMQGQFVVAVADGRAKLVSVQKGMESAGQTEVFGALRAGDVVLQTGTDDVHDGDPIKTERASRDSMAVNL